MSKREKETKPEPLSANAPRWTVLALGLVLLLTELVILPGVANPFRSPKQCLALAGILAVVCIGLAVVVARGSLRYRHGTLAVALAALPVLQAISALWGFESQLALQSALRSAVWVLAIMWIAQLSARDRQRLLIWCIAGVGISSLVAVLQAFDVPVLALTKAPGRYAITGLAGNPADISMAAVILVPLLLIRTGNGGGRWRWPIIALLAATPMISQTLAGLAAVLALAATWMIFNRSWKMWAATAAVLALLFAAGFQAGLGKRLSVGFELLSEGKWYYLLSARNDGWSAAEHMVRSRPLLGVGANNYTHSFYPSRLAWLESRDKVGSRGEMATHFEWAHCDPMQVLAELGVVGLLWMAALGWALVRIGRRAPPLTVLAAAATAPFLLMHYPTHLAVGMVSVTLVLAELLATETRAELKLRSRPLRALIVIALVVVAIAGVNWQLYALALDGMRAGLEEQLAVAQNRLDRGERIQISAATERMILVRIDRLQDTAPWLWRMVGKARLIRGDARGAETAFVTAQSLRPHEEADFGLGLALTMQGRRSEALLHFGRVCRVNPKIARQITDRDMRWAVMDLTAARRTR